MKSRKISLGLLLAALLNASCSTPSSQTETRAMHHSDDLIRSEYSPGELTTLCKGAMDQAQTAFDAIATLPTGQRTVENTLLAFESASSAMSDAIQPLSFMKYVSTNEKIHAEGAQCEKESSELMVRTLGRRDLYTALKAAKPRNSSETRLLKKTLDQFEANGLKLSDDKLKQVTGLLTRLSELQNQFSDNLAKDSTSVEFTEKELQGVSVDFLARQKKTDKGHYIVSAKVNDYQQLMQNVRDAETRRKMAFAYNNRQAQTNTTILEEALQIRSKVAHLMGFKNWADYQISRNRMAKTAHGAREFLDNLKTKLARRNQEDLAQLLAFKKTYEPDATKIDAWDIPYLAYQLQKRDYSLDDEKIREYFPAESVVGSMFDVYSRLLGVKFEWVQSAHTWAPNVKLYRISNEKEGRVIGYFYTDFFPRQGKFDHFAAFPLLGGFAKGDEYSQPVSAIVGNFNPPTGYKPSLLNHDEVVTLFHEFGHIMHQTLTRSPFMSLSGTSVAWDFVEAPSQMLENWTWEEKVLQLISGHYKDPTQKLPAELMKKMIEARDFQRGYFYTRQLTYATLDLELHMSNGAIDSTQAHDRLFKQLLGIEPIRGGHFTASFGHIMNGYDAGYYGYLWSLVYATDMFTAFAGEHLIDPAVGERYRREILEPGNMEDGDVLMQRFLGRKPSNRAFFKKLRIE